MQNKLRSKLSIIATITVAIVSIAGASKAFAQTSAANFELLHSKCHSYQEKYPTRKLPSICVSVMNHHPTQQPAPSPIPQPVPTPTPNPTPTPSPTPQPGQPYANAPACPSEAHSKREFHTLWNSELGCHYDHHHGDDPHVLDEVLGEDIYSKMGGSISYPWQTFSAAGLENDLKHAGYFWHVRKDIPCESDSACITAFRTLVHQHPTGRDATVRYHSYVFEAQTSDNGYILMGGWVDFGDLHAPEGTIVENVIGNHDSRAGNGAGRHKQHSPTNGNLIWYGASQVRVDENYPRGFVTLSATIHDAWDITNPNDPAKFDDYICYGLVPAGSCRSNATTLRPHLIAINMINDFNSVIDVDSNGRSDYSGYADRYGRPVTTGATCSNYSVDCSPMILRNLEIGHNYNTANSHTANSFRDHDIYFGNQSAGWNQPIP